jgi:hypothetical protein
MRRSTTRCHSSATATDANLAGKTVFPRNNRAADWRSACLGDSGPDISAEQSVSNDIADSCDCGSDYDEFAACRNGCAKFTNACHRGDADCGSEYEQFVACRNYRARFTKSYQHGDGGRGGGYDEFAACRSRCAKFTKSYYDGDSVRF